MEFTSVLPHQFVSDFPFVSDDPGDHVSEPVDELLFAFAEGDLVRDLVEVAHGLAAFAVESTNGEVDFLECVEGFVDFLGEHECRQVQQHADSDSGTDVGRAGGEVSKSIAEGEGERGVELVVDLLDQFPAFLEREATLEDLNPEVVFLVDHQADVFFVADRDPP